jgi:ornithine lipid ester-linked acyl 2-hydroxylase
MNIRIKKKTLIIVILILIVLIVIVALLRARKWVKDNIASGGKEINEFLEARCSDPPVFNSRDFKWSRKFREQWKDVREEFDSYSREYVVPSYTDVNRDSSAGTEGWKALFLRVFSVDTKMMQYFPKTKKLLENCECTTAYFSMLEPGTYIQEHKGVYKGVLRYHLGLIVPEDWQNCFIVVDGKKLHWKEGDDIMFDDMFLHHVENNTPQKRVVLFLDIKRNFGTFVLNWINSLMLKFIKCNDSLLSTVEKANLISRQKPDRYLSLTASLNAKTSQTAGSIEDLIRKAQLLSVNKKPQ